MRKGHLLYIQESVDFVNKVRTLFRDEEHVYAQFLDVLMRSKTEGSSGKDLFIEIYAIFCDHQDLLDGFRKLVSYDETHQQEENQIDAHQQEKGNSDTDDDDESEISRKEEEYKDWFKSVVVWWKKVMSKLSSSEENLNFLRCLYHYSRREIDKTQLLDLLKSQIGVHSELMLDLDQFLEYCDNKGGKKLWGPSYTLMPPPEKRAVVSEKEPELNEINDQFLCRANNQNFKGRLPSKSEKKKFEWEDRRHEFDLKLESVRSVITPIEQWLVYQGNEKKGMNDFISILNIKCIERVYGRQASVILERMSEEEYPSETLNLVLARMREIEKEQSKAIKKFRCMPKTLE
ncbi:hypothetical protein HS088_TW01G00442 [Tripterygium wilfordii]|uniref:Histone deacetylase interacting domain-containing protein n=1 Tax=Tripterygium wilfordii TaxID=458696 RepID=A0A7J7E1R7_TRIWF|nr:hypothetical protein HS088_TW01G00442 [Tripterygium wilfordii]